MHIKWTDYLERWRAGRPIEIAAESIHVSPRTLRYWLDGIRPSRSMLALIERAVARGAGIPVDALRLAALSAPDGMQIRRSRKLETKRVVRVSP